MASELLLDRRVARSGDTAIRVVLVLIALVAVLVPTLVVLRSPHAAYRDVVMLPRRVVPQSEVPPVEPVKFVDLTPDAARAYNAAQPFSTDPIPPAHPFRFAGSADDLARATDCLAAGVIYEAGNDTTGERAVAQVILNRLRHPAFPKTVCGVVFEGAERTTGCQFTFTCDGALTRWHPTDDGWKRAREVASAALAGSVDRDVGYATHYHTDWVVPYWQSSLDKIAAVHTHLFFRWSGWWGTPPAFGRRPSPVEPVIASLAAFSPAHASVAIAADGSVVPGNPFFGRALKPLASDPDTFLTALDPAQPTDSYKALALQACGERPHCKVLGWTDVSAMAFALPLMPAAQAGLSFSYLRDRAGGFDKALWNCAEFRKVPATGCMKRVVMLPADAGPVVVPTPEPTPVAADFGGVRRKSVIPPRPTDPPSPVTPAKAGVSS